MALSFRILDVSQCDRGYTRGRIMKSSVLMSRDKEGDSNRESYAENTYIMIKGTLYVDTS